LLCFLDDEMIGSKAGDLESKTVTDGKTSAEGPVCDVSCDTFFR
jgi:hypothetical protein